MFRIDIENFATIAMLAFYIITSSIQINIMKVLSRYNGGWVGKFYQKVEV
jgi:hypothetical protein